MLLITSGAFITGELGSEIGELPPSFLPVGNKRLYQHQIIWAKSQGYKDIYISLPNTFEIQEYDLKYLSNSGVDILYVPNDISLGESISYCLSNLKENELGPLSILHGDTLFGEYKLKIGSDIISIAKNSGSYNRAVLTKNKFVERVSHEDELIMSGYFQFTDGREFNRFLHSSRFNFVEAVNLYIKQGDCNFPLITDWLDFGHIISYYHSRRKITTQRVFNGLLIDRKTVTKSSRDLRKIEAEFNWFNKLPEDLKSYIPNVYGFKVKSNLAYYSMDYLYSLSLSDIAVFSVQSYKAWEYILSEIFSFIYSSRKINPVYKSLDIYAAQSIYLKKTLSRLEKFKEESGFDINQELKYEGKALGSLLDIAIKSASYIPPTIDTDMSYVHGDICFSNILFDYRSRNIKLIDPRGIDLNGKMTTVGDLRYDLAKLLHSVVGLYDFIISGRAAMVEHEFDYTITIYSDDFTSLGLEDFMKKNIENLGYKYKVILAITVQLFISMLPLHNDDYNRQLMLLANALRLHKMLLEEL
jgi:hypothetical protein